MNKYRRRTLFASGLAFGAWLPLLFIPLRLASPATWVWVDATTTLALVAILMERFHK